MTDLDLSELESVITTLTDGLHDAVSTFTEGIGSAATTLSDGLDDFHPELTLSNDKVTIDFENEKFLFVIAIVFLVYMVTAILYNLTGCVRNMKQVSHMKKQDRQGNNNQDSNV